MVTSARRILNCYYWKSFQYSTYRSFTIICIKI